MSMPLIKKNFLNGKRKNIAWPMGSSVLPILSSRHSWIKRFSREHLVRHIYGFDEKVFYPDDRPRETKPGLTMISVGVCAVRKGLHFALEAWLKSPASQNGTFLIAGEFLSEYRRKLAPMLAHPSIKMLGHRSDVPELMRHSDILVLPSIEEGFGLVCTEAMASGCVPLVSDACTDLCRHMENALVHSRCQGMWQRPTHHTITMLHRRSRAVGKIAPPQVLKMVPEITWDAAGIKLLQAYREVIIASKPQKISGGRPSTLIINR